MPAVAELGGVRPSDPPSVKIISTILACTLVLWAQIASATSNYEYGDDE